ncbi:MAG: hypothetical protein HW421_2156 [Ignavibacteria bacterium]|nr:hypothetical protein [Ignavibacteria bacterium]
MKLNRFYQVIILIIIFLSFSNNKAISSNKFDSIFTFVSPRPLINQARLNNIFSYSYGVDIIFSNFGFGGGAFFQKFLSKNLALSLDLYISGARNSDEFEQWYYLNDTSNTIIYKVQYKKNRLLIFPFMLGAQQNIFSEDIFETFKPYINFGIGPTLILAGPYEGYENSFFSSIWNSTSYVRLGGYVGFGASIGSVGTTVTSLNLRYYYIPFGDEGLESMDKRTGIEPIKNFGGVFISLTIGGRY